jgi:hypothetical protein
MIARPLDHARPRFTALGGGVGNDHFLGRSSRKETRRQGPVCASCRRPPLLFGPLTHRTLPSQKESKEKTGREIARHHKPHQHDAMTSKTKRKAAKSTHPLPTYRHEHSVLELRLSGSSVSRFALSQRCGSTGLRLAHPFRPSFVGQSGQV